LKRALLQEVGAQMQGTTVHEGILRRTGHSSQGMSSSSRPEWPAQTPTMPTFPTIYDDHEDHDEPRARTMPNLPTMRHGSAPIRHSQNRQAPGYRQHAQFPQDYAAAGMQAAMQQKLEQSHIQSFASTSPESNDPSSLEPIDDCLMEMVHMSL
jgi:hypothetical protein